MLSPSLPAYCIAWRRNALLASLTFFLPFTSLFAQWQLLGLENEAISAIALDPVNPDVLYAGSTSNFSQGTVGGLFKSTDQGASWDTLVRGLSVSEVVVHPVNPDIIFATSASPLSAVLKTTDAGATWSPSDSGIYLDGETGAVSFAIDPMMPEVLYCGTGGFFGGGLYKSHDDGRHWSSLHCDIAGQPCNALEGGTTSLAIAFAHPDTVYAGTAGYGIVKSTDGGSSWNFTGYEGAQLIRSIEIDPSDEERIFAGLSEEGLYLSTDGGESWEPMDNGLPDTTTIWSISQNGERAAEIFCVAAISDGWGNLLNNDVFHSINGGASWSETQFPSPLFYGVVKCSPENGRVYAGSEAGLFVMDLSLDVESDVILSDFALSQNYPNPFNPTTTIAYSLPGGGRVSLKVFDVLGREVATLVDASISAGHHTATLDAARLSSGVYFYRLATQGSVSVKRMILLK